MDFDTLWKVLQTALPLRIRNKKALGVFASNRAKFEGWLKVEVIDILLERGVAVPEKERIDIVFEDCAIELKTVNTNYKVKEVLDKTKPVTKNIREILKDINKLKNSAFRLKTVLFVVFPLDKEVKWKKHIAKIEDVVEKIESVDFVFYNNIPGKIYFGKI